MLSIETLIDQVEEEAKKEPFPIDVNVYSAAKKEPNHPILYGGNLQSQLCFFARDLGKDEVYGGEPLIGAAGSLVRQGFYQALHGEKAKSQAELKSVCNRILLTNTVPYKPPGNKAYLMGVKKRFLPFVAQLLVLHWSGNQIITLGTEAFKWFAPFGKKGEVNDFFRRSDRFTSSLDVVLNAKDETGLIHQKTVNLMPLPHPSPLNQTYYSKFPQMLQDRLKNIKF